MFVSLKHYQKKIQCVRKAKTCMEAALGWLSVDSNLFKSWSPGKGSNQLARRYDTNV